jgi:hypothetical protein
MKGKESSKVIMAYLISFKCLWYLTCKKYTRVCKFLGATQTVISLQNSQITFQIIFSQLMHISPLPFFMQQTLQASFLLSATCKSFIQGRYASSLCKLSNHSTVHSKIIKVSDDEIVNENTSAKVGHQSDVVWLHSLQY